MTPKHTPTPYKILDEKAVWPLIESTTEPYDSCGYKGLRTVAEVNGTTLFDKLATAKFIVESCNNYERLKAENEKLRGLLQRVIDFVYESKGVSGYHLNGDIASWGEFEVFNEIEQALKQE